MTFTVLEFYKIKEILKAYKEFCSNDNSITIKMIQENLKKI